MGIYAEGGRSRSGGLGEPRPGIGRVALESGAPVVPVAIHGSMEVRQWRRLRFPQVTVSYGEPLRPGAGGRHRHASSSSQAAERIFDRVRALYAELDR